MRIKSVNTINQQIGRLQLLIKRLQAERKVAVLREKELRTKSDRQSRGQQNQECVA